MLSKNLYFDGTGKILVGGPGGSPVPQKFNIRTASTSYDGIDITSTGTGIGAGALLNLTNDASKNGYIAFNSASHTSPNEM